MIQKRIDDSTVVEAFIFLIHISFDNVLKSILFLICFGSLLTEYLNFLFVKCLRPPMGRNEKIFVFYS